MKYRLPSAFLILVASSLTSLAQVTGAAQAPVNAINDPSADVVSSGTSIATSPNYILSPNDQLDIRVFQEDDLHTITRIPQDGVINFPLIGSIKLGGRSVAQATEILRSALQRDYLVNPQVNLTITEYAKRRFSIIGQVQKPGSYNIPDEAQITLLDAIATAGGYTRIANQGYVTVLRVENGQTKTYKLNAARMAKDPRAKSFEIKAGDTITVTESIF